MLVAAVADGGERELEC